MLIVISIDCNDKWIENSVPRLFKIRHIGELTDTSTGTIGAFCCYDGRLTMEDIMSLSHRYRHVLLYFCEPFMAAGDGEVIIEKVLRESPDNVMIFTDLVFDNNPANHIYVGNWWMTHQNLYSEFCWAPDLMAELRDDITTKPYYFDALLGARRPHRDLINENCQTSPNRDRILLTYHGNDARRGIWHIPYTAEGVENVVNDDPDQLRTTLWTLMPLPSGELGHIVGSQNIIPTKIYNDCWYSIIAEGFTDHRGTRLTEKTAKTLAAERLFVYFGAPHDLARMRSLGFQTFGDILDESYDNIEHDETRWKAAWQQVEWLCEQDPLAILDASRKQRAHNKRVFLETDWYAGLRRYIREICAKY